MTLGLNIGGSGGGDFLPVVSWDARAGRMFRLDRVQDGSGNWSTDRVDITEERPIFCMDFGSIEVGHIAFLPTGPDFKVAPLGQPVPERPSADHKQGFRVKVLSPKFFGGVREFASTAKSVVKAIDGLHERFEASPEGRVGQIPVVQLSGSEAIVTKGPAGNITSYSPRLTIVSWTERPAVLGNRTVPAPAAGGPMNGAASNLPQDIPFDVAPPQAAPQPPPFAAPQAAPQAARGGLPTDW